MQNCGIAFAYGLDAAIEHFCLPAGFDLQLRCSILIRVVDSRHQIRAILVAALGQTDDMDEVRRLFGRSLAGERTE